MSPGLFPILALLACTGGDPADSGTSDDDSGTVERTAEEWVAFLSAPGPHGVGFRVEEVRYTDPAGAPRTLELSLWYPTPDTEGDGEEVVYLEGLHSSEVAISGATVLDGVHPVVVWSHGHQAYAGASAFLTEHLASHGWVAAAPAHTNNTTADGDNRTTEIYFQRPADISAVIDHLAADWADRVDLDTLVAGGHSFGGYGLHATMGATHAIDELAPQCADGSYTGAFCDGMTPEYEALFAGSFEDDRIRAGVSIGAGDWDLFGTEGLAGIDVPGLWITGDLGYHHEENETAWTTLQGGPQGAGLHRRGVVEGAGHNFCTDLTWAVEPTMPIEDEEGFRIANVLVAAWARRHGLDDPAMAPLLDGQVEISELLSLSR